MENVVSRDLAPLALIDTQPINIATQTDVLGRISARMKAGLGFTLFTLNMDHLVKRRGDEKFRAAYDRATFVTADGAPIVALARRQGAKLERTTGADMVWPVCELAARDGIPVYFFGSSKESLDAASVELKAKYPSLDIRGMESPPMGFDPSSKEADAYGQRIVASGAKLCFVLLGAPKQELFSDRMWMRYPRLGFLCVGAAVDFISGQQKRAPVLMQKLNLEWAWRLMTNPGRLAMRYAKCAALLTDLAMPKLRAPRIGSTTLQGS